MALWGLFGGKKAVSASPVPSAGRNVWLSIHEAATGNWQRNITVDYDSVRAFHTTRWVLDPQTRQLHVLPMAG